MLIIREREQERDRERIVCVKVESFESSFLISMLGHLTPLAGYSN